MMLSFRGAESTTFLAGDGPIKWALAFSVVVKIPVDSHTCHKSVRAKLMLMQPRESIKVVAYVSNVVVSPSDILGVSLVENVDLVTADDDVLLVVGNFDWKLAVGGIVFQLICHVFRVQEGVVHRDNLDVRVRQGSAEDQAANPTEPIDAHIGLRHGYVLVRGKE